MRSKKDMEKDRWTARVKVLAYDAGFNGSFLLLDHAVRKAFDLRYGESDAAAFAIRAVGEIEEQRAHGEA